MNTSKLCTLFFVGISLLVCSFAGAHSFAGLKWNSTPEVVHAELIKKGFTQLDVERFKKIGGVGYAGTIMAKTSVVTCFFNPKNELLKILVSFPSEDHNCIKVYNEIKTTLVKKYGKPSLDLESYEKPYKKDDGFAEQALKMEKATFMTGWDQDVDGSSMTLQIAPGLSCWLHYESKDWPNDVDRRNSESSKEL